VTVTANPPTPTLLAGRYQLGAPIGRGSSALVYSAIDTRFNRWVTVKLFDSAVASDPSLRTRFQRQTAKAAKLRHPNIAAILDAGINDEPGGGAQAFVVTEPAGAMTLRAFLDRRGRLTPERAVRLAREVATALSYAHRLGVIHADVKPENVVLDESGERAKLVDFSVSFVSARTGVVTPETIARRAAYLAPEQVRGEAVTYATDVYGLGVLLYEMVAGRPPFVGGTPQATAERRVYEHARPVGLFEPSIPAALEAVVARALERSPDQRWASIDHFGQALDNLGAAQLRPVQASELEEEAVSSAWQPSAALRSLWGQLGLAVPILAAIAAFVFALTFLVPLLRTAPRLSDASRKPVSPNVVGMSVGEARSLAGSRGLEVSVLGDRVSDRVPKDLIVQQAPISGWQIEPGEPLRVTVSAGVAVPDVRGKSLENAAAMLSELGWRVARVERGLHPGYPSGTVALQHPPPGEVLPSPGELLLAVAQ
jgi:hypothetical protein